MSIGANVLNKHAKHGEIKTILKIMIKIEYVTAETLSRNSIVSITLQMENILSFFGKPHSLI